MSEEATLALREAYWKIRKHADAYCDSKVYRQVMQEFEADPEYAFAARRAMVHKWFSRGLEAAARDIAEILDVAEHEIETSGAP